MRLLESLLRRLIFNLMIMAITGLFIIKSFGSIGIDISSVKSGVDTFKQMANYSGNINSVFDQIENLGK